VPPSTSVVALASTSMATRRGVSQARRCIDGRSPVAGSPSARLGGLSAYSATPDTSRPAPTASSATVGRTAVASRTATAGPTMKDSSTDIESRAYACRR
jgi:hypothetical protein